MKLINIGFGNMVNANRLVAIVSPESAPIKRIIQDCKERGTLMDENNYQFAITAWGADYDDAMTYLDLYLAAGDTGKSTHYRGNYASAEYNDLINKAKVETDAAVRLDEMLKAEKLLVEQDCVVSGLYHRGAAYLIDDSVNNFVMHPFGVDYEFKYASFN